MHPEPAKVVAQVAATNPADKTVTGALDFTVRVAQALADGAGLLAKPSGENIAPYHGVLVSAGRICYPNGQLFKVLTDVPTTNGPSWQDNGTVDPSRFVAVDAPVAPPVVPDPPPAVPCATAAQADALARQLDAIVAAVPTLATKDDLHALREEFVVAIKANRGLLRFLGL
jgi:hypothetical protein